MYQELIRGELTEAAATLDNFLKDENNIDAIRRAAVMLADSFKAGGKVMSCGNGGSHCDAMHFAEELTGRYRENRRAIRRLPFQMSATYPASAMILAMNMFSPVLWNLSAVKGMCYSVSPHPVIQATLLKPLKQPAPKA